MQQIDIADVRISARARKDIGDISDLVDSIEKIGLLHPIVITEDKGLVSGSRRLEAFKRIGRTKIPCTVAKSLTQATDLLIAERDENICRKDFTLSEKDALWDKLESIEKPKAAARKKETQGRPAKTGGKFPPVSKAKSGPKTREKVGKAVGMSARTRKKVKAIIDSGDEELMKEMDKAGKADGAFKKLQAKNKKKELEQAQKKINDKKRKDIESVCSLRVCSCRELFASGIVPDCVITDPPYPKKFLPVFSELAESCKTARVPLVAVMSGQSYLPDVIQRLCEHLQYRWTLAYMTPGGQAVQQWTAKVNTAWKPVLLFGDAREWFGDVAVSRPNDNDKRFHNWGQSESGMADLVDRLTKPGQLVCDPFLGGGTTALACIALGRRFVGCDIDADCVAQAKQRVEAFHGGS